jgi:hypothetical protein
MFGPINEIKDLAFKYSKPELGRMAQLGMIEPQKAMMAGMMRDRISKEDAKPPTTTVAQDVLGMQPPQQVQPQPQQMGMPQLAQAQGQPQPQQAPQMGMPPQPAQPPMNATRMAATGGLTSLPVPEHDYAGGGIVAFDEGGEVPRFRSGGGMPQMPTVDFSNLQQYTAEPVGPDYIPNTLAEAQQIYEQQGIVNPYEGLIKQNEDKRAEIGTRKEQAKGEFLMNLGAGLMNARQGQEVAALGAGATKGMADYKDAMKDVRASEERLDDRIGAFKLADYQAKKTGTDAAIAKRDAARKDLLAAKNKNVETSNAAAIEGEKIKMQGYNAQMGYRGTVDAAGIHNANMPDLFKIANSKQMTDAMPNATFAQRLEAAGNYLHPKDTYNALVSRANLVNKSIAASNDLLRQQYNAEGKTDAERKAILEKMKTNAASIREEQGWTDADDERLKQEHLKMSSGQQGQQSQQGQMKPEERQAALAFIQANPNDPRTPAIKAALGM